MVLLGIAYFAHFLLFATLYDPSCFFELRHHHLMQKCLSLSWFHAFDGVEIDVENLCDLYDCGIGLVEIVIIEYCCERLGEVLLHWCIVGFFCILAVDLGKKFLSGLRSKLFEALVDGLASGQCPEVHFILIIICPMISIGIHRSFKEVQHARRVSDPDVDQQQ